MTCQHAPHVAEGLCRAISAHTAQEHLTAAIDKFGVRSRRELVAAMLTGRPG